MDAVVSDDSDCFCYGAKTVLRNFSTDPKNFSVTRCTARRLREELGLSRQRLVVMALLLGSDYNPGELQHNFTLKKFRVWTKNTIYFKVEWLVLAGMELPSFLHFGVLPISR